MQSIEIDDNDLQAKTVIDTALIHTKLHMEIHGKCCYRAKEVKKSRQSNLQDAKTIFDIFFIEK